MIVRDLRIGRFGILAGQELSGLAPGLNIFLGDNEAGKSTCRNFFRAMFFGYKRRGRNELDYSGASGMEAGGELGLESGRGERFSLIRRPGKHGGELDLYDAQGRALPPDYWQALLSGVTEELYDRVFAFDLSDLTTLESMGDSRVAAALHGAAFGTGFKSPSEVLARLDKEMSDLFSPSGNAKNPAINVILRRLQGIGRELAENGSEVERYAALQDERAELEERLSLAGESQLALQARQRKLQSLADTSTQWAELRRLENELALRPHPGGSFGPESLARLEKLCAERDERLAALNSRRQELAELENWLAEAAPDKALLAQWPQIRALNAQRLSAGRTLEALPPLEAEIRSLEAETARQLRALGTGWSLEKAAAFDLSITVRDQLARFAQRFDSARRSLDLAVAEQERLEREYRQAALEEKRIRLARGATVNASGTDEKIYYADTASVGVCNQPPGQFAAACLAGAEHALTPGEGLLVEPEGACENRSGELQNRHNDNAAFGPEMRLLLEERWRRLEEAGSARAKHEKALADLDVKRQELQAEDDRLSGRIAMLDQAFSLFSGHAAPDGDFTGQVEAGKTGRQEFLTRCLREVSAFRQGWLEFAAMRRRHAELLRARASFRPPLFSARSISEDRRRGGPALVSLAIAALAAVAIFSGAGGIAGAADAGLSADLLKNNWPSLCLLLAGLWSALFWLSPKIALLGRYQPRPDALALQAEELESGLAAREWELERLSARIRVWLPPDLQVCVSPAHASGAAGFAGPSSLNRLESLESLADILDALEDKLFSLQNDQVRQSELELQREQKRGELHKNADRAREASIILNRGEQAVAQAYADWRAALAPYGLGPTLNLDGALQIFDRAARTRELAAGLERAVAKAKEATALLGGLQGDWVGWLAQTGLSQAGAGRTGLIQAGTDRVEIAAGSGAELTPEAAQEALSMLEKIQERNAQLERRKGRKRALDEELAAFGAAFGTLAGQLEGSAVFAALLGECGGLPVAERALSGRATAPYAPYVPDTDDAAHSASAQNVKNAHYGVADRPAGSLSVQKSFALFDRLYRAAEDVAALEVLQRERQRDLRTLQTRMTEAETVLQQCENALFELFQLAALPLSFPAGAAADTELSDVSGIPEMAELFRLRYGQHQAHEQLRLERERLLLQLRQYAAHPSSCWADYDDLAAALESAEPEALSAEQAVLRAELEELASVMREASVRQGEIKAMLLELERGGAYAELRQEEAVLKERLAELSRRWMVLSIARSSILRAKRSFEEDRQDLVVRQAGDFFSAMTGGVYRGLTFDLEGGRGGLKALAVPASGSPLDAEHALSRGTREQLYLALRLAFVRQHNQTRESLPVIMDDILVNFDPRRAELAAGVLASFAAGNQLFFFTCHPGTAEILAEKSRLAGIKYSTFMVENGLLS